jgi:hypothetical protein
VAIKVVHKFGGVKPNISVRIETRGIGFVR